MIATQRVERNNTIPLLQTYSNCLGIFTIDSFLYVFYPNTIRVYEQFPHKLVPEISKEFIISQGKIVLFTVSEQYIAILYEDAKLEVRFREYWEKVQYSFNLTQQASRIQSIVLVGQRVIFKFVRQNEQNYTYGFLTPIKKEMNGHVQVSFWKQPLNFEKVIISDIGSIDCFYFGIIKNQIRYGMYYPSQNQILKQFEFGKIDGEQTFIKTHGFCLIKLQQNIKSSNGQSCQPMQETINVIGLVKIQNLPQQNEHINDRSQKLAIDYIKFYENTNQNIQVDGENIEEIDPDKRRLKLYENMVSTLSQFNKNQIIIQNTKMVLSQPENKQENREMKEQILKKNQLNNKRIVLELERDEKYDNFVQKQNILYVSTNKRIYSFIFSLNDREIIASYSQFCLLSKGNKLIEACQNKLYLSVENICIFSQNNFESIPKSTKKLLVQQTMQTQDITDVLLNQIQQNELTKMIDNLLEKKNVCDVEVQTQFLQKIQQQIKDNDKDKDKQQNQILIPIKEFSDKSVGENLPLCPDSHHKSLQKIEKNITEFTNTFQSKSLQKFHQLLKRQQQKSKVQISKRIQQLINTTINSSVLPLLEVKIQQIFETKLQEVNGYIYTLALNNLLQLKQEIQRDEVSENMIRTQLIKKQIHQIAESKKAVALMVDVCKKREIQKLVFFQEVKKKFFDIQKKVGHLQQKLKTLIESEEITESKIFDEIQLIKSMLKNQGRNAQEYIPSRKRSTVSQPKTHAKQILKQESRIGDQQQESLNESLSCTQQQQEQLNSQIQDNSSQMSCSSLEISLEKHKRNQRNFMQGIPHSQLRQFTYPQINPYFQNIPYSPYNQSYMQQTPMFYNHLPQNYGYGTYGSYGFSPPMPRVPHIPQMPQMPQIPQVSEIPHTMSSHLRHLTDMRSVPKRTKQRGQIREKQVKKREKKQIGKDQKTKKQNQRHQTN